MLSKDALKERVHSWAERLDVEVRALSVRPMRRKWASCSTDGSLSFSTDLLALEDHDLRVLDRDQELVRGREPENPPADHDDAHW